jgi:serine/threonine protein kinase
MAELTVESGPLRGRTLVFSESDPFVVGSAEGCTLQLGTPGVADRHLVIKALKNGGFGVKRLDAGFLLNGKDTDAARLSEGDVLEIGNVRLRFGSAEQDDQIDVQLELEGYRLIEVLGEGGHGTVYRAEQLSLHREIALKVLHKDLTKNPEFVGRFVAEARAAARLSHPNVVQVFDVGHDGDTYYLSMEIMGHGSLEDRLKRGGRIPVEEGLQLIIDAAKGLSYAESMRIVHRDIKPDNLMVDTHDTAKIADLGLAMPDDAEQGKIVGTPHFMSPEQVLNKPLDHRSDLYSLGCTFFRLVTGRTLFQCKTTKEILTAHVKSEPDLASDVHDDVPMVVADIIDRLVEKAPEDRFQSAEDLIDELELVLHPPAKKGPLIGVIAVSVLIAGYALYWGLTQPKGKGGTKIVQVTDPKLEKELREEKALTRFNILVNRDEPPMTMAASLDTFSKHKNYSGTKAATDAVAKAKDLRTKEGARLEKERIHAAAVATARDLLKGRIQKLIDDGKFKEAAAGFNPGDISKDILREEPLQVVLTEMNEKLLAAAGVQLSKLKSAVDQAKTARDPDAVEKALSTIDIVLDTTHAASWPREAFADRGELSNYLATERRAVKQLRQDLASSRESSAWANYRRRTLSKDGILQEVRAFDLSAAANLAAATNAELKDYSPGPRAKNVLDLVTSAVEYEKAYLAAIKAGKVMVPVDVDDAVTDVKVISFATSGENVGLTVEIPKGDTDTRTIPLETLRGSRLFEVFVDIGTGDDIASANRVAFLSLHILLDHIDAASSYMAKLDPADIASGTGENRFVASTSNLKILLLRMTKMTPTWREFLSTELRAAREVARALRSFSRMQYTSAHGYLENTQQRYKHSLATLEIQ